MENIFGEIEIHCSYHYTDKCDFAELIRGGECLYNNDMVCSNSTVFKKLVKAAQKKDKETEPSTSNNIERLKCSGGIS